MTILKFDPVVIDNPQITFAAEPAKQHLPEELNPPLFLERKRSFSQMLASVFSIAVFTLGLYLKFIGGKK